MFLYETIINKVYNFVENNVDNVFVCLLFVVNLVWMCMRLPPGSVYIWAAVTTFFLCQLFTKKNYVNL